jgi:hypothetical protein
MLETKGQGNNKMKITKKQLRRIIRESMMQHQGEWDPASSVPPEAFGGGGPDRMKGIVIKSMADFYSISSEELTSALGTSIDLTPEEISEVLQDALVQARKTMPFDERHGSGKETRIGQHILRVLGSK